MSKEPIGIEINLKDDERIVEIPTSPELKKYFKKQHDKNYLYYLKQFLGSKKNYEIASKAIDAAMEKALPENRKENCKYCNGEGQEIGDKNCAKYILQMQATYMIAASEFVNLVFQNRYIYDDKPKLQNLTMKFFDCLYFIKDEGKMYIDLEKICRYTLNSGFLTLSEMLANSEKLNAYKIINRTLDELNEEELQNKVLQKEDENYLELQKEFFENKLRYYKEELFIEERENIRKKKNNTIKKAVSIPQYALYYYYLQESGDFGRFENHPKGKVKAISELIENEKLDTTTKYFQKEYNKIAHYNTNRIAKNKVAHIDFVANTMLKDFSKARKIALSELKQAKTKNK